MEVRDWRESLRQLEDRGEEKNGKRLKAHGQRQKTNEILGISYSIITLSMLFYNKAPNLSVCLLNQGKISTKPFLEF